MTVSDNVMDGWIMSFTQSLLLFVHKEMAAYRLYTVVPRLIRFVDHLTNWYVRMNRKRLKVLFFLLKWTCVLWTLVLSRSIKGDSGREDCHNALQTLFSVLFSMIRIMAPFTPFLTELMYRNLRHLVYEKRSEATESVHFLMTPQPMWVIYIFYFILFLTSIYNFNNEVSI